MNCKCCKGYIPIHYYILICGNQYCKCCWTNRHYWRRLYAQRCIQQPHNFEYLDELLKRCCV